MTTIKSNRLDYEMFGEGDTYYFIDLNRARNDKHYLAITRSDAVPEKGYKRSQLIVFEDDFGFFIEALSMLLKRYSHGELKSSC